MNRLSCSHVHAAIAVVHGVLLLYVVGCSSVSATFEQSDMLLAFTLFEADSDGGIRPMVLLLGEGEILARDRATWSVEIHSPDGREQLIHPGIWASDWRTANPYFRYIAHREIPNEAGALIVTRGLPVWTGPLIDSGILEDTSTMTVTFVLDYYSCVLQEPTSRHYQFSGIPITSRAFHKVPFQFSGRR